MTRENKLALVVGFALILFVGILISDHFSTARGQEAANLRRVATHQPIVSAPARDIDLLPPPPRPVQAPTPAVSHGSFPVTEAIRPEQRTTIDPNGVVRMGHPVNVPDVRPQSQTPQGFVAVASEPEPQQVKVVFHDVGSGETLYAIARQYYGDTSLAKSLGKYNNMDDPASMRVGRRLMIPKAEELGGRSDSITPQQVAQQNQPTVKPAATKTYTVQKGDSLAQIAQRFLGSRSKWKKLHEMNRDVVDDPDNLKIGTVLKVL